MANSKHSSKKNFFEEVGVGLANAFREDRTGDKTNLTGMAWKEVAKYKCKMRFPLGSQAKRGEPEFLGFLHERCRRNGPRCAVQTGRQANRGG